MTPEIEIITADNIAKYHLVTEEVLETMEERRCRYTNITKAMILGKAKKGHSKIVIDTKEGIKSFDASILATDEYFVYLKGGINIPMLCIREVFI